MPYGVSAERGWGGHIMLYTSFKIVAMFVPTSNTSDGMCLPYIRLRLLVHKYPNNQEYLHIHMIEQQPLISSQRHILLFYIFFD